MRSVRQQWYGWSALRRLGSIRFSRRGGRIIVTLLLVDLLLGVLATKPADGTLQPEPATSPLTTVSAPPGRTERVELPDGSTVTLAPGSTIAYSPTLDTAAQRTVRLEGEGYFEVQHSGDRPFWVRAGNLIADIDAKCVVRAYPEEPHASVAVREGTAAVADTVIRAGEVARVTAADKPVVQPADTASWFSWINGRLVFTEAFRNALPRLSRWYNLDLRIADTKLGDAVLVATLPDTIADGTLEGLALALSARIERKGRVITFYPGLTNSR